MNYCGPSCGPSNTPPCRLFWWRVRWYRRVKFFEQMPQLWVFSAVGAFAGLGTGGTGIFSKLGTPNIELMWDGGTGNSGSSPGGFPCTLYGLFWLSWFRISIWPELWASSKWRRRNSGREKRFPQMLQLKLCSGVKCSNVVLLMPECRLLMWRERWSFFEKDLLHSWHTGRFFPSTMTYEVSWDWSFRGVWSCWWFIKSLKSWWCLFSMWTRKWPEEVNMALHSWQMKRWVMSVMTAAAAVSSPCTLCWWRRRWSLRVKSFEQYVQWYGFSFECTSEWRVRWSRRLKLYSHSWHLYAFELSISFFGFLVALCCITGDGSGGAPGWYGSGSDLYLMGKGGGSCGW